MSIEDIPASPVMGQCTITGQMVPEDELITLHGHRVCAEGKAILLERLKSGEALPGEREKPTVLRRFGCIFLDGLIIGVPFGAINFVLALNHPDATVLGLVSLLATAAQIVYFGQMHGTRAQTVGKIAGKLIVIKLDGTPMDLRTGYVRALAYTGVGFLSGIALMTQNLHIVAVSNLAVSGWGITNALFALFDRNQQRALHDRIAGTRVVEMG